MSSLPDVHLLVAESGLGDCESSLVDLLSGWNEAFCSSEAEAGYALLHDCQVAVRRLERAADFSGRTDQERRQLLDVAAAFRAKEFKQLLDARAGTLRQPLIVVEPPSPPAETASRLWTEPRIDDGAIAATVRRDGTRDRRRCRISSCGDGTGARRPPRASSTPPTKKMAVGTSGSLQRGNHRLWVKPRSSSARRAGDGSGRRSGGQEQVRFDSKNILTYSTIVFIR